MIAHPIVLTALLGGLTSVGAFLIGKPVWKEYYQRTHLAHEHNIFGCDECIRLYRRGERDGLQQVPPQARGQEAALRKELETLHKVLDRLHVEVR